MSKERNYGIDCLRILATYFICIHHILGHGGALLAATPFSPTFIMLSVISSIVTCAVNCYGLISGYVGINRQFSYKSLINMWKMVVFYTVCGVILAYLFVPEAVKGSDFVGAVFPIMSQYYWYFTCYSIAFYFFPFINKAFEAMSKEEIEKIIIAIIVFLIIWPYMLTLAGGMFGETSSVLINAYSASVTNHGYSPWWLLMLYIIGAYIGKHEDSIKFKSAHIILIYIISTIINSFAQMMSVSTTQNTNMMVGYLSPTTLFSAFALLYFFKDFKISPRIKKIIAFAAPTTFAIYIIQEEHFFKKFFVINKYTALAAASPIKALCLTLILAATWFIVMCLIERCRLLVSKVITSKVKKV